MLTGLTKFIKAQPVLTASFLAALITVFIVPPDAGYLDYCNYSVLCELFALMISVAGLRGAGMFEAFTSFLLKKAGSVRRLALIFILLCFFSSMLFTNDVALITFVPLTLLAFSGIEDEKSRIMTIVLETAAANLGSMMTPIGNPQNLYIYDEFSLTPDKFLITMLPAGVISLICLVLLLLFVSAEKCDGKTSEESGVQKNKAVIFGALFILCIITVFKVLPFYVCAAAAVIVSLIIDRKLLLKADYSLLLTFVFFFIFVGNISRIEAVHTFFSEMISGREIIVSALLSQVISNVPAAVMLSGFTDNGVKLLIGVNIGGLGTPIASMASLISLQFYRSYEKADTKRYLKCFSIVNFSMLILLLLIHIIFYGF